MPFLVQTASGRRSICLQTVSRPHFIDFPFATTTTKATISEIDLACSRVDNSSRGEKFPFQAYPGIIRRPYLSSSLDIERHCARTQFHQVPPLNL